MKHLFASSRCLRLLLAMGCLLAACKSNSVDTPAISCPNMKMAVTVGTRSDSLNFTRGLLIRQRTDSGILKLLSVETISDSFKVILNISDGIYDETSMKDDSLHLKTYTYSRLGRPQGGLVVVGMRKIPGTPFDFLTTDSSSITLERVNVTTKTITGTFYFTDKSRAISGSGRFETACFLSLE
ncbi:hypothetical protein [Chitinophaga sp. 212800010-3]|uniref:hypothetical protein n=1 Tax=unclassified Chitinophaga TaxID=2619133 RepID=UPI002DE69E8D|nr:DUF2807 domain-containing protein [Chitinophaga sp. 212800010-3]